MLVELIKKITSLANYLQINENFHLIYKTVAKKCG